MIGQWALVESDFARVYGIDLVHEMTRMTWRRFMVLLYGLGPTALCVQAAVGDPNVRHLDGDAAERYFAGVGS